MGKRVTQRRSRTIDPRFGLSRDVCYVGCDDGTTYVFERAHDMRTWRPRTRIDADGTRTHEPSRLPAHVALLMGHDFKPFAFDPGEERVAV